MSVTDATLRALRRMRVQLDQTVDPTTRGIVEAWGRAWAEVADEYEQAINDLIELGDGEWPTRSQIRRARRAQEVLTLTADRITDLSKLAGVTILRGLPAVTEQGVEWLEQLARTQLPRGQAGAAVTLERVDARAIDAIVKRTTRQITSTLRPLSGEATRAMRSALIRGVQVGDNPKAAARLMLRRTEGVFDGGRSRAVNIARTEMVDAWRESARQSHLANADVLRGWAWNCTLNARSCIACLSQHGTEHKLTEPGPSGHPSCRCSRLPLTKSWRDLGIDLDEPASTMPDAKAWFEDQPTGVQKQIMGPARYRAYAAGDMGWDQMAVRRKNPGWRDAYVPAPAPVARQRAA